MGTALNDYLDNLEDTKLAYTLISVSLGRAKSHLDKMLKAVKSAEKAIDKADNLDDFAKDLGKLLVVLKSFPPLKSLAKIAEKVVKSAEKKSGEFLEDLEKLQTEIDKYKEKFQDAKDDVSDIKKEFDSDKADLSAAIPGISDIQSVFATADDGAPASLASLETSADALLATLNAKFPQTLLQNLVDNIVATTQALAALAPLSSIFDVIAAAFSETFSKVSFLDGPLDGLVDALDGFLWILEKIDAVISIVLDPIIDPILKATGLDDLIDDLADTITSLLPDIDLINPFATLGADLSDLFGAVEGPNATLDITFIQTFLDAKNNLFGALYGDAGYLAPLFATGTDGFDILVGRPGINLGFVDFGSNFEGGDTGDILVGGSASDVLNGGTGDDLIIATGGDDTVEGGAGDEDIFASTANFSDYSYTLIDNGPGDQTIILTYQGADPALLGTTRVSNVEFLIFAGTTFSFAQLADAITGQGVINGTELGDLIFGSDEADTINGLGGDDRITGFGGRDTIDGGAGNDTVDYSTEEFSGTRGAIVDLNSGPPRTIPDTTDVLINIENVIGTEVDDVLLGNDDANRLSGRGGSDIIAGFGGDDILIAGTSVDGTGGFGALVGGDGDDVLISGNATGRFVGGRGNDTYLSGVPDTLKLHVVYYSPNSFVDYIEDETGANFAAGWPDYINVRVLDAQTIEVEKVYADVTYVDKLDGRFVINGTTGDDYFELLNARGGFVGEAGDDVFVGYTPDIADRPDVIFELFVTGGPGNDRLVTFSGDEHFRGDDGDDTFEVRITRGNDYAPDFDTVDFGEPTQEDVAGPRVRYWDGGNGFDTIDLSGSDLDWVMAAGMLISTIDNNVDPSVSRDNRKDYDNLDDFEVLDAFDISGFDQLIGSDVQEAVLFIGNRTSDFTFIGNGGNDYIWAANSTGDLTLDMGDGDDEVTTGQGIDTVLTGAGNDSVWVYSNASGTLETVDLGTGNDYLTLMTRDMPLGSFDLEGGTGRDMLDFSDDFRPNVINLQDGTFSIAGGDVTGTFSGFEAIMSGDGDNIITGDDADNIISGGTRDDTIFGGGGNDILYTGTPSSTGSIGEDFIYGGAGNDLIFAPSGRGVLDGGDGFDTVQFNGFLNYSEISGFQTTYEETSSGFIRAEWVIDLDAGTAEQTVFNFFVPSGGPGGDFTLIDIESVIGGFGDDTIYGKSGIDNTLDGFDGNDDLYGKDGDDTLIGGRGDDRLFGAAGDDVLIVGGGENEAHGGADFDTLDLRFGASDVTINADTGTATYTFEDSFPLDGAEITSANSTVTFGGIESFGLSEGADVFTGSNNEDTVRGWGGDDEITGGGGADTLYGGGGNDTIYGGGGSGIDAGNYLDGGGGDDMLFGGDFADVLFDAFGNNTLHGGGGDDVLTVMSGDNTLNGDVGHDLLIGGSGSDTLNGGAGNDVIVADTSNFWVGNDTLTGGSGDDLLQGGGGADVFVFSTDDGNDVIAQLNVDPDNLLASGPTGVDFQVGVDTVNLIGFGYTSVDEVMANISDVGGSAVFSDQDTTITFFGLTSAELSSDDFVFV